MKDLRKAGNVLSSLIMKFNPGSSEEDSPIIILIEGKVSDKKLILS